jgi:hypothetical protein
VFVADAAVSDYFIIEAEGIRILLPYCVSVSLRFAQELMLSRLFAADV